MMQIGGSAPYLQLRQQYAQIGVETKPGQQQIEQPRADLNIETTPAQLEINSTRPQLHIDQSKAWDALGRGGILEAMDRIYANAKQVGLDGIARRAQNGDRLAAIHLGTDAIADIGQEQSFEFYEFDYVGYASYDNVTFQYTSYRPELHWNEGKLAIHAKINPPVHQYERGALRIYMQQYGAVEVIPPAIDLLI